MHALFALALIAQAPFPMDTVRPPGGPEVLWHRLAGPVVALRLSVPLHDALPGAAEILQELARPAATREADRLGAAVELRTAGDEAILLVTGPTSAFDALVGILRGAVGEQDLSIGALRTARARAEDRLLARLERPEPRLRAILDARLAGTRPAGPGVDRLGPEHLRAAAARLHHPDRLRVIFVGDVPPQILRSAFAGWRRPPVPATTPPIATAPPLPSAEAHHAWAALAYPLDVHPAVLAVAAELVARRVRAAGLLRGTAEARIGPGSQALVILGGAPPDDPAVAAVARITAFPAAGTRQDGEASPIAHFLRRLLAEAATLAGPAAVADAAAAVRRTLLLEARTAPGRAEVLGRWSGPRGARRASVHNVLDGLDGVTAAEVRDALLGALESAPVLAEVWP
ncbi:MAG TPA: hypothetical protein VMM12_03935 [Longimicrobiales bacterium]|nr:hypothetical protein [Longimicrobiales bacterium]